MHARAEITRHTESDRLHGHRHTRAYVALLLDGRYEEFSADGAWSVLPGNIVVHPRFHLHANTFGGTTKVLNWRVPDAISDHPVFQDYRVLDSVRCDDLLRPESDPDALLEVLSCSETVAAAGARDWIDLMAEDIAADPCASIADLARRFSVTPEHASRRCRQRFLMTPATVRSERRFRNALELLRRTSHSLSDIAQMAGYTDQPHFTRSCRQATGLSPGKLRRSLA